MMEMELRLCRNKSETPAMQGVFGVPQSNLTFSVQDINKIFGGAGIAAALALRIQGDEVLTKARSHGGGNLHNANGAGPSWKIAGDKSTGRAQSIALLNDVTRGTEKLVHRWGFNRRPAGGAIQLPW